MDLHLSDCLKEHSFLCMPKIPYDQLFIRQSMINNCIIEDKPIRAPFALFKKAFLPEVKSIEFEERSNSKILFYISETKRPNSVVNFKKVISTIDERDVIMEEYAPFRFSFNGFILFFILQPIWFLSMLGKGLSTVEKIQVLKELTVAYHSARFFRKIDINKYNLLVTFNDSLVRECLLTLLFKQYKINTASLQHGQFNAWREDTIANCGLEFSSSLSEYQLCWNRYAQEEAIKAGLKKEYLPIVGIMSNIGRSKERCSNPHNRVFGVVISHPYWDNENIVMIKAANLLAKKIGYKYLLKLHPSYALKSFDHIIDKNCIKGVASKVIDTLEFANSVEFSIVGSSSVFAELSYFFHDILRYSSGKASDKYGPVPYGSKFTDVDNVVDAYTHLKSDDKEQLFEYLCASAETDHLYHDFFNKFC